MDVAACVGFSVPDKRGGFNRSPQHSARTHLALKTKAKNACRIRSAGTLSWLGFHQVCQTDRFSRESIVESMRWMVLHRPVEPASVTGEMDSWYGT